MAGTTRGASTRKKTPSKKAEEAAKAAPAHAANTKEEAKNKQEQQPTSTEEPQHHPLQRVTPGMNPRSLLTGFYGPRGERIRHVVRNGALSMPKEALELMAEFEQGANDEQQREGDNKASSKKKARKMYHLPGLDSVIRPTKDKSMGSVIVTDIYQKQVPNATDPTQPPLWKTFASNRVLKVAQHNAAADPGAERIRGGGQGDSDAPSGHAAAPSASEGQSTNNNAGTAAPAPATNPPATQAPVPAPAPSASQAATTSETSTPNPLAPVATSQPAPAPPKPAAPAAQPASTPNPLASSAPSQAVQSESSTTPTPKQATPSAAAGPSQQAPAAAAPTAATPSASNATTAAAQPSQQAPSAPPPTIAAAPSASKTTTAAQPSQQAPSAPPPSVAAAPSASKMTTAAAQPSQQAPAPMVASASKATTASPAPAAQPSAVATAPTTTAEAQAATVETATASQAPAVTAQTPTPTAAPTPAPAQTSAPAPPAKVTSQAPDSTSSTCQTPATPTTATSAPIASPSKTAPAPAATEKVIPMVNKPNSQWNQQVPSANDENATDTQSKTPKPDWYDPKKVSSLEKTILPEWFDESASHRNEKSYIKARETMIRISDQLGNRYVTSTLARRSLPGDVGSLHRLHQFLTNYMWINEDARNDSAPTAASLQQPPQLDAKNIWTNKRRGDLMNAVVESAEQNKRLKSSGSEDDPMDVDGVQNEENSFVPIDWGAIAEKVGASPGECEREFLAMPLDGGAVASGSSTERPITPDTTTSEAKQHAFKDSMPQEEFLRALVDQTSPRVIAAVTNAALQATDQDLKEAQNAARLGLVASQAVRAAQGHEETVSRLLSEVIDQRMQKLECRMSLMDDLEGMLEAERVSLEIERRDLYTTRCRDWFGGA